MFRKVLIANRGEIACRVIRTCRRLGIATVAVYSDADANAQHVMLADEAVHIGGSRPVESYLLGDVILEAAKQTGAQAIHPGYGFLSENADFAEAVETAGLVFIGPNAASMRKMGSKAGAKILMQGHGVPVVPGYTGEDQDAALLQREADRIGYPLMIKAAHGGGGKGMRIVRTSGEFAANLESCQREAKNAFGRERVLLERYVETPRHIEIQIFGDAHGEVIHLNERECSAQRRYQKVIEESPSPFLTPQLRAQMGAAAVAAGKAIDYRNAGTVEFIVGPQGDFYFMEINTRLQVEHPVTELVTGLDLVEWQLRVAAGGTLPLRQEQVTTRGHAIEVRLYAEDPEQGFLPGSGRITRLALPAADAHVRIDGGVVEGDTVSIYYDPMIAKLIVHDADRPAALRRLAEALAQCDVLGPKSNIDFLEQLIRHPAVVDATIDTGYLDRHLDEILATPTELPEAALIAVACAELLDEETAAIDAARASSDPHSPWGRADAWRLGHAGKRVVRFEWREHKPMLVAHGTNGRYALDIAGRHLEVARALHQGEWLSARLGSGAMRVRVRRSGADWLVFVDGRRYRLHPSSPFAFDAAAAHGTGVIKSPMPGRIIAVKVAIDVTVEANQELVIMEAMKMEITLRAPHAGKVVDLRAVAGDFVEADVLLAKVEAA
ncbi:MAG: acetyl/propionyl/methylcrotonyl-CoA carboxylase subunit alpha [Xanthomonadales bacterium]|nr:acetyl/propionyl/methylcrotonyl-CoA carboxylase subunit alpha [Xanthomonadales bacterium]